MMVEVVTVKWIGWVWTKGLLMPMVEKGKEGEKRRGEGGREGFGKDRLVLLYLVVGRRILRRLELPEFVDLIPFLSEVAACCFCCECLF